MDIFDIIGPVMIGPSSSHTAGAVRMGNLAAELLDDEISSAVIYLHGSFALTAKGHGTERAIAGGLLGFSPDDERIRESLEYASDAGVDCRFIETNLGSSVHPNTAQIIATGKNSSRINLQFSSIGGGRIILNEIDSVKVRYEGRYPTLIIFNKNVPGVVVSVSGIIAEAGINIAQMRVYGQEESDNAVMIINMNKSVDRNFTGRFKSLPEINKVIYLDRLY